jgi:hypothetical protein
VEQGSRSGFIPWQTHESICRTKDSDDSFSWVTCSISGGCDITKRLGFFDTKPERLSIHKSWFDLIKKGFNPYVFSRKVVYDSHRKNCLRFDF